MSGLLQDVRLAVRLLGKDIRFTAAAVLALGLGIGVNTSVFGLINAAFFRELPFDEADRLMSVRMRSAKGDAAGFSVDDFHELRTTSSSLDGVAASVDGVMNVSEEGRAPERLRGTYASANTFAVLRTAPVIGRTFAPEDDRPGAPAVLIIGYGVWQDRYGADPAVLGRAVRVNDAPATVIGVMPAGFKYPFLSEAWQPLALSPAAANPRRDARPLGVVARLRDAVELPRAQAEVETIAARLAREYAATNAGMTAVARPLKDSRPVLQTPILAALVGAVVFVLLIAYANLANLLLARSVQRSREIAIRTSLGATRWRIARQVLIECGLLAAGGGLLGLLLSVWGVNQIAVGYDIIEPGAPGGTVRPYWLDVTPDLFVHAFAGGLAMVSALAFGLLPAWHMARSDTHEVLKDGGRSGAVGSRARRWTGALLTAEITLTMMLLTSAGLLWRSFAAQYRAETVIDISDGAVMRMALPPQSYRTPDDRRRFFAGLEERLRSAPGVSAVALASHPPLEFGGPSRELRFESEARAADDKPPIVSYVLTGPRYFETLRLPIVRGRALSDADARPGADGVVVDQRFVERFSAGREPLGRRIQLGAVPFTIVGVARTVPLYGPPELVRPVVYAPFAVDPAPEGRAVVIGTGELTAVVSRVREVLRGVDANLPLFGIETLRTADARRRMSVRLIGTWFGVLAVVALVLASVGLYALTAHGVAERVQEIGIRMALGAESSQVQWLFLKRTLLPLGAGLALGIAGAVGVGQLLQATLRDTSARDPLTMAVAALTLVGVAAMATLIPARRASRVDPAVAMRTN